MEIAFKQVEDEVRRLVAENPEFVYVPPTGVGGSCVYLVRGGDPEDWEGSCLFGRVFLNLFGKDSIPTIRECETQICSALFTTFKVNASGHQKMWAAEVQSRQDKSLPWGACLVGADEMYPLEGDK